MCVLISVFPLLFVVVVVSVFAQFLRVFSSPLFSVAILPLVLSLNVFFPIIISTAVASSLGSIENTPPPPSPTPEEEEYS